MVDVPTAPQKLSEDELRILRRLEAHGGYWNEDRAIGATKRMMSHIDATTAERDALKLTVERLVEAALGYRRVTWRRTFKGDCPEGIMDVQLMTAIDEARK